jgi:hypothetical protein
VVHGNIYEVISGIVYSGDESKIPTRVEFEAIRLAYAKMQARVPTPLSLPEVDLNEFNFAVDSLLKAQSSLAHIQETEREKYLVTTALYPTSFLKTLSEVENNRRNFLKNGDRKTEIVYEHSLREAVLRYRESLVSFRDAFEELIPKSLSREYAMADVILERQEIIDIVNLLIKKSYSLSSEVQDLFACTHLEIEDCEKPKRNLFTSQGNQVSEISNNDKFLLNDVFLLRKESGSIQTDNHIPFVLLSAARCLPQANIVPIFVPIVGESSEVLFGQSFVKPIFIGDIRLIRVSEHNDPYSQYISKEGVLFLSSDPFIFYKCLQGGTDYSSVFATKHISDFTATHPLSAYLAGVERDGFLQLEKRLSSSRDIISETDAINYIVDGVSLIQKGLFPTEINTRLLSLYSMLLYHSAGISNSILHIVHVESQNLALARKASLDFDFSAPRLFLTESGFFRLFLADALLSDDEKKNILKTNNIPDTEQPFEYYSSIRSTHGIRERILQDLTFYRDFRFNLEN